MKHLLGSFLLLLSVVSAADTVVTVESVESYVNIRSTPESGSDVIGRLEKGVPLEYVGSVAGWHEVVVSEGLTGFVSADWSEVVAADATAETPPAPVEAVDAEPAEVPEAVTRTRS